MNSRSFVELMRDGADGREMAQKLIRVTKRAEESKAKLDKLLAGRITRLQASDMGTPSLDEEV